MPSTYSNQLVVWALDGFVLAPENILPSIDASKFDRRFEAESVQQLFSYGETFLQPWPFGRRSASHAASNCEVPFNKYNQETKKGFLALKNVNVGNESFFLVTRVAVFSLISTAKVTF